MWHWNSWLSHRGVSAVYSYSPRSWCHQTSPPWSLPGACRRMLRTGFPRWEGGCPRALRGSLSLYRLPNRISISSQPDFFILKNEDAQNNSFLRPKEMIWNSGKSLFLETFPGPLTQEEVWALRRTRVTAEGVNSLAWEPHWTQQGSLWTLCCMTLNPQKDTFNNTSQRSV